MKLPKQRQPSASSEREERIQAIVHEAMNRTAADDSRLEQEHPHLMPELGERLRTLRAIQAAALTARYSPQAEDPLEAVWRQDLAYLQDELPNYEILERVEYGGQGIVYKAAQRTTKRIVAIKVLLDGPLASERQRRRFAQEVELCSRLNHPNIVTVYEGGVVRGRNYCAMEFVEGLPIDDYVFLHAPPVREIVRHFITVCLAVSHAHQRGIIHRDLSPANILVDVDGVPRILDFGLAKDMWRKEGDGHSRVSVAGQVIGTLPYLSPEQVSGLDEQVDVRSDIYSLGVVLYRLLTGALPYEEGGRTSLQLQILDADPLPMQRTAHRVDPDGSWRELSRDLEMIIRKALAKDKEQRYQSAAALAEDLERYLKGEAVSARANHSLYVLRKTVRRHRGLFGAAAVVLLTLAVSAAVATGLWLEAREQRDKAREGFRVAHSIFDKVVTDIDESIRPLAGGTAVSNNLLNVVADELPALEALAASDQTLTDVTAKLYERQGDIFRARREHEKATENYETFLRIAQEQFAAAPANLGFAHDAARAHFKLGEVSYDPRAHYRQAIQIEEKLLEALPDAVEFASVLVEARIELSHHLWRRNEFGPALAEAEAALNLVRAHSGLLQTEAGQALLALAYERYSDAAISMGRQSAAVEALRECSEIRNWLSAARPVDVNRRYMMLRVYLRLGAVLLNTRGGLTEAHQALAKAAQAGEYLLAVDPTIGDWRQDLYAVYDRLFQICLDVNNFEEARACLEKTRALLLELPAGQAESCDWTDQRARMYLNEGRLHIAQSEFEEAKSVLLQATVIRELACASDLEDANCQSELARAYEQLGKACRKLRQMPEAWDWYKKSYDIRERLFCARPDEVERELQFIFSKSKLAGWHLTFDTPEADAAAAAILDEVEVELRSLEARGVSHGWLTSELQVIQSNRDLLTKRAALRAASQSSPRE